MNMLLTIEKNILPFIIVATAMILLTNTTIASTEAYSRVGITKLASLQVTSLDSAELYSDTRSTSMRTSTCLQTGGDLIPYRVRASSLNGNTGFKMVSDSGTDQISYNVTWDHPEGAFQIHNDKDISQVQNTETTSGCDYHTVSIQIDDRSFESAAEATYTDALSVIFVIE